MGCLSNPVVTRLLINYIGKSSMLQIQPEGFTSSLRSTHREKQTNPVARVLSKYSITQAQLAWLMGVQPLAIHMWKSGKAKMSAQTLMLLDMLEQGYAIPDSVREKYVGKPKFKQWRKSGSKGLSLSLTDTLMSRKSDGT